MLITPHRKSAPWDARMLAMADRLFAEFEALPVRVVFEAIGAARAALRADPGSPVTPEGIETLARDRLRARATTLRTSRNLTG